MKNIKDFVRLCEQILPEASTSMNIVRGSPGAEEVVKTLHDQYGLSHNQGFQEIPKISWGDLKDSYKGAWVLIKGAGGTGSIKWDGRQYHAIASDGSAVEGTQSPRGGDIVSFLKQNIGQLRKMYVGPDSGQTALKKKKRAEINAVPDAVSVTEKTLLKKFKPLWQKAISAAMAETRGVVLNMIKNGAYEKSKRKINRLEDLENWSQVLDNVEDTRDIPDFLQSAISIGILMAAHHYYPEETGDITKQYGGYRSERAEGVQHLLKDLSAGDTQKLGTVLSFFKQGLITG